MKIWLTKLIVISITSVLLFSCKKDEVKTVVQPATQPVLASSGTNFTLTKATENNTAVTFTITPPNFGYNAAVTYTLQFAKPGNNFVTIGQIQLPNMNTTQPVTVKALNIGVLNAGLDTLSSQPVQVRLKADIGHNQPVVYSNVLNFTVKPYSLNSYLYVPGDYQGWDPASAPKLISINSTGRYEGYVNLTASGYQGFKFTDAPSWAGGIYGDANSSGTSGNISSPGNDIKFTTPGYYLLKPDLNSKTYTMTATTWAMIGDFNGWGADAAMTYNPATKVWTGTINAASAGGFKFRANGTWTYNFGDNGANGSLEYDGANIAITAGAHTITLDLHLPGAYTYTIL